MEHPVRDFHAELDVPVSLDLKWHCFVSHTSVSKNKEAAKSLLVHLSQPSSIEKLPSVWQSLC
jgi:hypothetical protein